MLRENYKRRMEEKCKEHNGEEAVTGMRETKLERTRLVEFRQTSH